MKLLRKTAAVVTAALLLAVGIVGCTSKDAAKDSMSGEFGLHGDNLTWELDGEGVLTISGKGEMDNSSSVPWHSYSDDIVNVVIEDGVTSIGDSAFYSCESLTSITIPDSVTSIGDLAFSYCYSLTSITIPNGVTSIGDSAFESCHSLTSITIPDSVTGIGNKVFCFCVDLTSITIPSSVADIAVNAFWNCNSLTSINVDSENKYYTSEDGVLFNKDKTAFLLYPKGKTAEKYVIPDIVTSIGGCAFKECESLTSIIIPDSVTSIGDSAFFGCKSLTSITIPDSITSIVDHAFKECESLTSITIPDSVTSIGNYAFNSCSALTSITIPDSITSIGHNAFNSCSALTSITIPDSVTSIGNEAFNHCIILASINVDSENKYYASEDGILFNKDKSIFIRYPMGKTAKEYVIPDSVTSIRDGAFACCESLTSIAIPDSVTSIGDYAFSECKSLTSITISDSVTTIGICAFAECKSLTSITIENPDCDIYDMKATISDNIPIYTEEINGETYEFRDYLFNGTIYGYEGSTAQAYAKKYGRKFIALLSIVKQPKDVYAANGEIASVTVKAIGEGLIYKWYFKNKHASEFTYTSSFTGAMYSTTMNDARDGRQIYCVITDKYGNSVKTDTVTLIQE